MFYCSVFFLKILTQSTKKVIFCLSLNCVLTWFSSKFSIFNSKLFFSQLNICGPKSVFFVLLFCQEVNNFDEI